MTAEMPLVRHLLHQFSAEYLGSGTSIFPYQRDSRNTRLYLRAKQNNAIWLLLAYHRKTILCHRDGPSVLAGNTADGRVLWRKKKTGSIKATKRSLRIWQQMNVMAQLKMCVSDAGGKHYGLRQSQPNSLTPLCTCSSCSPFDCILNFLFSCSKRINLSLKMKTAMKQIYTYTEH